MSNPKSHVMPIEELKTLIVTELNIGHLDDAEQDTIISQLSDVLLKRATLAVMRLIPEGERDALDKLVEAGDGAGMQALISKYVPNVEQVMREAVRAGIDEHKQLLSEAVAN